MIQAPGSGNFMVDQQDKEKKIKDCTVCGGEDGYHYCACGWEINETTCKNRGTCVDCK